MKLLRRLFAYSGSAAAATTLSMAGIAKAASGPFNTDNPLPAPRNTHFDNVPEGRTAIVSIANTVFNIVMLIAGILAVLYLIWSGVQYITAGGNADRTKAARAGIVNAVIGIIVILAAFFLVRFAVGIGRTVDSANTDTGYVQVLNVA